MDGVDVPGFRRSGNEWAPAWRLDVAALPPLNVTFVVSQAESTWPPACDATSPPSAGG